MKLLAKRQLENFANAKCSETVCTSCNLYDDCIDGYIDVIAQTALAYREMLERARKTLQDAWDDDGSAVIGNQILETINAIDALLGGEKDV